MAVAAVQQVLGPGRHGEEEAPEPERQQWKPP